MVLLGDAAIEPRHDALAPGRPEAFRLRARAAGIATRLRLYIDATSTAKRVVVGLYRDARGGPGALLASGSIAHPQQGAWNTVTLAPSPLAAGRPYWLTVLGEGGTLRYRARRHGHCSSEASVRARLSALPTAWSAGRDRRHAHCPISAYAAAASAGAPVSLTLPVVSASPPGSSPAGLGAPLGAPIPSSPANKKGPPGEEERAPAPPASGAPPTIGGTLTEGDVLSSTPGTWSGGPTKYAYQWKDCDAAGANCSAITGATGASYTLTKGDVGHTIRVTVTATNEGGSTPATSAATGIVTAYSGGSGYPTCTQTISQGADVPATVAGATPGSVICLSSGAYGEISLHSTHTSDVTLQAAPGAHVTAGRVALSGSHLVIRGLWIDGEVALEEGTSFVTIDRNDITNEGGHGGEGIVFDTSDCTAPNAPKWAGCEPHAPISDVTISHNHFHDIGQGSSEDSIHLDNWRNVTVTGNEFDHIVESGNHTDCLQSVYGGENLVFDHNYEHDNNCQGFFIKDGDATNVSVTDNLFLRDHIGGYANFAQIWNTKGLTVQHNTIWDGKGLALVTESASFTPTVTMDHNVISNMSVEPHAGPAYALTEGQDIFGEAPNRMTMGAGDSIVANPKFTNTAADDYRLVGDPNGIGIDWSPAEQQYGPAS